MYAFEPTALLRHSLGLSEAGALARVFYVSDVRLTGWPAR